MGTLRWSLDELAGQGDFFDECYGFSSKKLPCTGGLYLWSEKNPAEAYGRIECAVFGGRNLADARHDIRIENLSFEMSGVHGVSGKGIRTEIFGCRFRFIGGCVWSAERKIRFGNAVEFWNICEDTSVESCIFDEIYDSCVTHQGGADCLPARHVRISRNLFSRYGGAYELPRPLPVDTEFSRISVRMRAVGFLRSARRFRAAPRFIRSRWDIIFLFGASEKRQRMESCGFSAMCLPTRRTVLRCIPSLRRRPRRRYI